MERTQTKGERHKQENTEERVLQNKTRNQNHDNTASSIFFFNDIQNVGTQGSSSVNCSLQEDIIKW